ncbi:MAG: hypothetical protein FWB96_06590 [Defluviitaleaceae bacterium]|nr:hypothetical protein [Defluviitaleaceae bacterium]MCL2263330.1 hypothetical protein [Defluviitaleaceae bacterium]
MMKLHRKKIAFVLVLLCLVGGVIYARQTMEVSFFGHIRGLNVELGTRYEVLIERMGEPLKRETEINSAGHEFQVLHYDGVSFFVRGSVFKMVITGEQYRLGGRGRIGVGSARAQVIVDKNRRQRARFVTGELGCCSWFVASINLNGDISYTQHLQQLVIEFNRSGRVTQMTFSLIG